MEHGTFLGLSPAGFHRIAYTDFAPRAAPGQRPGPPVICAHGLTRNGRDFDFLAARLDAAAVDWVGTSMGGLIGMMLAAQPASPIRRLVLNDVGPWIPAAASGQ